MNLNFAVIMRWLGVVGLLGGAAYNAFVLRDYKTAGELISAAFAAMGITFSVAQAHVVAQKALDASVATLQDTTLIRNDASAPGPKLSTAEEDQRVREFGVEPIPYKV